MYIIIFINMEPIKLKNLLPEKIKEQLLPKDFFSSDKSGKGKTGLDSGKGKTGLDKLKSQRKFESSHPTEYKIANKIYNAKGYIWDNEYAAVKAIKSIKDKKQYDIVQKIFGNLTAPLPGRNVIDYVASFIQVHDSVNTKYAPITIKYIESLIKHLNKIGVSNQSIKPLSNKLAFVKKWYAVNVSQAQQPGPMEFAWDTWMKRSLQDPEFKHAYLGTLSMVTSFIPGIGLMISSGIMLADAAAYWQEGNRLEAGSSAVFALLPAALKGVSKIPFIQKLGAEGMAALAEKLATSKYRLLQKTEIYAIQELVNNKDLIKRSLDTYMKARVKNELVHILNKQTSKGVKGILTKIGNGTLKTSVLGTKAVAKLGAYTAAQDMSAKAWDGIYKDLGWLEQDVATKTRSTMDLDPSFQQTKKKMYGK
jgi:hypothetical protein